MSDKTMQFGEFCWNELMTPDSKKAKQFYSDLFGWQMEDMDMGQMIYTMIKNGEKGVGGLMQTPKGQEHIPPHWLSYVSVENVDAMLEKAKKLGATIKMPATNVADYGRFAVLQDPTGAHIAIWQSLKNC